MCLLLLLPLLLLRLMLVTRVRGCGGVWRRGWQGAGLRRGGGAASICVVAVVMVVVGLIALGASVSALNRARAQGR